MSVAAIELEYAYRECEQITRREAANFYYGIRLLPRSKRQAMCAVYAFARRVDDIGDGDLGADAQVLELSRERTRLATLDSDADDLSDPVMTALAHATFRYNMPRDAFTMLIDGVDQDVHGTEYESFDQLVGYCRCVAGTIGRLCVAIFTDGRADARTFALADDLGVAMQVTNILRDVVEDQQLGRIYLPAEDRRRFGCPELGSADRSAVGRLIEFEAKRACDWFDRGMLLSAELDRRSAACLQAMTGIYRRILARIVEDPTAVLSGRIRLTPLQKTWVAARSLIGAGVGMRRG